MQPDSYKIREGETGMGMGTGRGMLDVRGGPVVQQDMPGVDGRYGSGEKEQGNREKNNPLAGNVQVHRRSY